MSGLEARLRSVDQRYKADRNLLLGVLAAGILVQALLFWFVYQPDRIPPALVTVSDMRLDSPAAVCPGDTLAYSFTLTALADAVVAVDGAVYRKDEPQGLTAWSDTRRLVLPAGARFRVHQRWFVPTVYWDWISGQAMRWMPGTYERLVAVGTTSRNTVPQIQGFVFTVKEVC